MGKKKSRIIGRVNVNYDDYFHNLESLVEDAENYVISMVYRYLLTNIEIENGKDWLSRKKGVMK